MTKSMSVGRRSLILSVARHSYPSRIGTVTTRGGGIIMRATFAVRFLSAVLITRP